MVIEMNPRVSRSSALASKATGFPIAKIAAKLAVGYTLDEIRNDITRETPACFEPTIDYVVTKIPRFTFEKFPQASDTLGPQMKSVGEAMAIGRTFKESLQKAMRSLEIGSHGFEPRLEASDDERARTGCAGRTPTACGIVGEAFRRGMDRRATSRRSTAHRPVVPAAHRGDRRARSARSPARRWPRSMPEQLRAAQAAGLLRRPPRGRSSAPSEAEVRDAARSRGHPAGLQDGRHLRRRVRGLHAVPLLDLRAGRRRGRGRPTRRKIVILGGGPNRIGQGIEFDYCCVHAAFALREDGFETIMVNCNPETVSTDYDTSDKLYFEPLTLEDVLALHRARAARRASSSSSAARRRCRLAVPLERAGVPHHRHVARLDRPRRGPRALRGGADEARPAAPAERHRAQRRRRRSGSRTRSATRCWCGRPTCSAAARWRSSTTATSLGRYMRHAVRASPEHPVLIDQFLEDAIEVDVDAVSDGTTSSIGGIMEHIERAGVHSGDSACSLPPYSIDAEVQARDPPPDRRARPRARRRRPDERAVRREGPGRLRARGEPARQPHRAVRLARRSACRWRRSRRAAWSGRSLRDLGFTSEIVPAHVSVKEAVFPFIKFPGVDTVLGPEMKSTGEVMGIDATLRRRLREGADRARARCCRRAAAPSSRCRTSRRRRSCRWRSRLARAGFRLARHAAGRRRACARHGLEVDDAQQGAAGQPAHRRLPAARRGGAGDQHAVGRGVVPRLVPDPAHRARAPRAVLHDDRRRGGRGRGHRDHGARPGHGAPAPGALPDRARDEPPATGRSRSCSRRWRRRSSTWPPTASGGAARTGLPLRRARGAARARAAAVRRRGLDRCARPSSTTSSAACAMRRPEDRGVAAAARARAAAGAARRGGAARDVGRVPVASGAVEAALAALGQPVATLRAVGPKRAAELDALRPRDGRGRPLPPAVPLRGPAHAGRRCRALRPGEDATAVGEVAGVQRGSCRPRAAARSSRSCCATARRRPLLVWFNQVAVLRDAVPRRPAAARARHGSSRRSAWDRRASSIPTSRCSAPTSELDALPALVPVYEKPTAMPVGRHAADRAGRGRGARRSRAGRHPAGDRPARSAWSIRRARSGTCTRRRPSADLAALASGDLARASLADLRRAVLPPARSGAPAQRGGRGAGHRRFRTRGV